MYVKTKTGIVKIVPESLEERARMAELERWWAEGIIIYERTRAAERAEAARKDNPK